MSDTVARLIEAAELLAQLADEAHCPYCETPFTVACAEQARERLRQAVLDHELAERLRAGLGKARP